MVYPTTPDSLPTNPPTDGDGSGPAAQAHHRCAASGGCAAGESTGSKNPLAPAAPARRPQPALIVTGRRNARLILQSAPCGSRPQLFDNMAMYSVAGSSTSNPVQVDRTALAYSPKTLPAFPSRHNWDLLWREACPPPGSSDHSQKVAAGKEETRK